MSHLEVHFDSIAALAISSLGLADFFFPERNSAYPLFDHVKKVSAKAVKEVMGVMGVMGVIGASAYAGYHTTELPPEPMFYENYHSHTMTLPFVFIIIEKGITINY